MKDKPYRLSEPESFGRSLLWRLQDAYFLDRGVDAWRQQEVPHYLTCNLRMARAYAEIVFAFWQDQQRLSTHDEPLFICELGGGSGRFAYHFLCRLQMLCTQTAVSLTNFRYILTDIAPKNIEFWHSHLRFQPFIEAGVLDFALFDVSDTQSLDLIMCQERIIENQLNHPIVVVGNYLFDSIPQELYYFKDSIGYQCLLSLFANQDPAKLDKATLFDHIECVYEYKLLPELPYLEAPLRQLFEQYQHQIKQGHLFFPDVALRSLQRLKALSKVGLLLLAGDKGSHKLEHAVYSQPPKFTTHGSFSLSVNFHAFRWICEQEGGLGLFPNQLHHHLTIGCLLFLSNPAQYPQTIGAYERQVQEFGPDDFYSITKHARQNIAALSLRDILAYTRLSLYDAHLFAYYVPRLIELAPELTLRQCQTVCAMIDRVWSGYFPLGEARDLAFELGQLLVTLGVYDHAIHYLDHSVSLYGEASETLIYQAFCYQQLAQNDRVEQLLQTVLTREPNNLHARRLLGLEHLPPNDSLRIAFPIFDQEQPSNAPDLVLRSQSYGEAYAVS